MWLIFEFSEPRSTCLFMFPLCLFMIQLEKCNLVMNSFQMQNKIWHHQWWQIYFAKSDLWTRSSNFFDVKRYVMGLLNLWGLIIIINLNWWKATLYVYNGGYFHHMLFGFPTFSSAWFQYTIATHWILTFVSRGMPSNSPLLSIISRKDSTGHQQMQYNNTRHTFPKILYFLLGDNLGSHG